MGMTVGWRKLYRILRNKENMKKSLFDWCHQRPVQELSKSCPRPIIESVLKRLYRNPPCRMVHWPLSSNRHHTPALHNTAIPIVKGWCSVVYVSSGVERDIAMPSSRLPDEQTRLVRVNRPNTPIQYRVSIWVHPLRMGKLGLTLLWQENWMEKGVTTSKSERWRPVFF